ncbi:hypothetical protein HZB96_01055 [Candidatus Gottesmanbacteria bacterium]|nr:hypothetical protein [Candidatus Gottesmanbacteria bacterium]
MSIFPNWEQYAVSQKRPNSGCIPTGYEILLRAANVLYVDYATFQDEFDFDKNLKPGENPTNNFQSVADAISKKYPKIKFKIEPFSSGQDKLKRIEELLAQKRFVLISLSMTPFPFGGQGWHIMPIVDIVNDVLILLIGVDSTGKKTLMKISKQEFVKVHDKYPGGNDIAYLEDF